MVLITQLVHLHCHWPYAGSAVVPSLSTTRFLPSLSSITHPFFPSPISIEPRLSPSRCVSLVNCGECSLLNNYKAWKLSTSTDIVEKRLDLLSVVRLTTN